MARLDYGVDYRIDAQLATDTVQALIVTGPYPQAQFSSLCDGHYQLSMSITPRPPMFKICVSGNERQQVEAPAGELILVPADHVQRGTFLQQEGYRRDFHCMFPKDRFEALIGGPIGNDSHTLAVAADIRNSNILAAARRLARETMIPGFASEVLADSIATTIAIDIGRHFAPQQDVRASGRTLSPRLVGQISEYIQDNRDQRITLEDIAKLCSTNVRTLVRLFKETTGRTVADHIATVRLDIAKQLLRETTLPPKAIAARVGFASVSGFATAFRRHVGVTPGQFRDESRNWEAWTDN